MTLRNVALTSLMRQKGRKSFVFAAMVLGCATVVGLFSFVTAQKRSVERQFDEYGANIVIVPKSDNLALSYGGVNLSGAVANVRTISLDDIDKIWEIPNRDNLRAVAPKLLARVPVETGDTTMDILFVGAIFEQELRVKSWWEIKGRPPKSAEDVLVGSNAAEKLGVSIGDVVPIAGSSGIGDRRLKITGILAPTGSQDDDVVFADFDLVASLSGQHNTVSLAEVSALCSDCPIDEITGQLAVALPGADIKEIRQVMQQRMQTIDQIERFAVTTTGVIVLIGAVLVFTSMMGSVADRKHEIGIFRALGFRRTHIATIVLTEALALSLAAGICGTALGILLSYLALPSVLGVGTSGSTVHHLLAAPVLTALSAPSVVLVGLVAALYPALKASRIDPVTALSSL